MTAVLTGFHQIAGVRAAPRTKFAYGRADRCVEHGAVVCLGKPLRLPRLILALRDIPMHGGLTCNRWGSLIPPPVREPVNTQRRFRGIAAKLSASRKDRVVGSRK